MAFVRYLRDLALRGAAAAKSNLVPGIILWCIALVLMVSYFFFEPTRQIWESLAELKSRYGFLYSAVATALLGGVVPFLIMLIRPSTRPANILGNLLFFALFWAWKGMEVDLLYRLQGMVFGTDASFSTIAAKVAVDQFVYNPLWALWTVAIPYFWREHDFNFRQTARALTKRYLFYQIPSVLLSTWMVWVPAVSIVYLFPSALQIPLFNIVLCFWSLMLIFLSKKEDETPVLQPEEALHGS